MKRAWPWLIAFAVALIAGIVWVATDAKLEIRQLDVTDDTVSINLVPPPQAGAEPMDSILQWIGPGLTALALAAVVAAVAFTVWAILKQVRLIRRGRPDSR